MFCETCNGTGKVIAKFIPNYKTPHFLYEYNRTNVDCIKCKGTGKVSKLKKIIEILKR